MTYILLFIGFIFLIKGAGFLVDGASSLAKKFNVSNLVIGLTIVAFGTSAPELFVNIFASLGGTADIAIGNIVGSNIANILLILGITAIIYPLRVGVGTVWKEIPFGFLGAVLLLIMANDMLVDGFTFNLLTRGDGVVLIAFFIIFLYYVFEISKHQITKVEQVVAKVYSWPVAILLVLMGLVGLVLGGKWIIASATTIAANFGLSDALIGLTIIAVGTSLPELATSAVAAFKKNTDIAVGNIIGSNIFNIFWVLGVSSIIKPLPFRPELNFDIWVVVLSSALLFGWMSWNKRHVLGRRGGVVFVLFYVAYMVAIVMRG